MPRVLISDELSPRAVEIFKERGVEVELNTKLTPDELKKEIGRFDGLAVRSATQATKVHPALKVDLKGRLAEAQERHAGAMFSGCGGGYLVVASEGEVPGGRTIKVRTA